MINEYLEWRKAESIPSLPDDHVGAIMNDPLNPVLYLSDDALDNV